MSGLELGFWSFPVLLIMVFLRAPIGLAMMICGFGGWYFFMGGNPTPLLAKLTVLRDSMAARRRGGGDSPTPNP